MIRILVVDDLKMICKSLKTLLSIREDFEVIAFAHNGKEAIERIEAAKLKPDIVLMDLLMPVMGGIEATQRISQQFPEVKVIILSSLEDKSVILKATLAGAKKNLSKSISAEDLTAAIYSIHTAPIETTAKTEMSQNSNTLTITQESLTRPLDQQTKKTIDISSSKVASVTEEIAKPAKSKNNKVKSLAPEKPLFNHGDWISLVLAVIMLSQTKGMGHHLAHAGLLLLMLGLVARSIRGWWDKPLKYRRTIGILAFAASLAHAIYATLHITGIDPNAYLSMATKHQLGILVGLFSLSLMAPAAVTSFRHFQKKLGKNWRKIHLLTVPALALAVFHTILTGPHYLSELPLDSFDRLRSYGISTLGFLVLFLRRRMFWFNFFFKKG